MTSGKHLTVEERARILELGDKGLTARQIADRFGLKPGTIRKIRSTKKGASLAGV